MRQLKLGQDAKEVHPMGVDIVGNINNYLIKIIYINLLLNFNSNDIK